MNPRAPLNLPSYDISPWIAYDGRSILINSDRRTPGRGLFLEFPIKEATGSIETALCSFLEDPEDCPEGEDPPPAIEILRGDSNDDGFVNISDPVSILNWLFADETAPVCVTVADANGDRAVDLADAVYLLNFLFAGGPAPEPPFPDCGPLPADEDAMCDSPPESCP